MLVGRMLCHLFTQFTSGFRVFILCNGVFIQGTWFCLLASGPRVFPLLRFPMRSPSGLVRPSGMVLLSMCSLTWCSGSLGRLQRSGMARSFVVPLARAYWNRTGLLPSCLLAGLLCRGLGGVPSRTSQPGRRVSLLARTGLWHQGWGTGSHPQAVQLARLSARGPGDVTPHRLPEWRGTVVCTL